jgi:predicted peptidase
MQNRFIALFVTFLILTACVTPSNTPEPTATQTPYVPSLPTLSPESIHPGQSAYSFLTSNGEEVRYILYLPEKYNLDMEWPTFVFLHGTGEVGTNINLLMGKTLPNYVDTTMEFPFIVVSPQLPSGLWLKYIDPVNELLDHLIEILPIDPHRLYATGYSAGGYGTWKFALNYPDRFAAIAPIAGGASLTADPVPDNICVLKELPIWVFHGEADEGVPYEVNSEVAEALEKCGSTVKFTLYPDTNHLDTWLKAYADPALFTWFLEQSK